jgi:hypothetical protein
MTIFKNPNDPDNHIITAKVQEWVKDKMTIPEGTIIEIQELNCSDPGCMDKETRIFLSFKDNTRKQFRIHKPLVYIRKRDVDQLMKEV